MKHIILAAAVALALTGPAGAIDADGKFTGFNQITCPEWNEAKFDANLHVQRAAFLAGYFSAMNRYLRGKKNWLDGINLEMAVQATYEYCKDRPDWSGPMAVSFLAWKLENGKPLFY